MNDTDSAVDLVDTVGQKLRLGVENIEGQGGERHITVFCPYWVINTSQYKLRIRDDRNSELPAGTVFPHKYVTGLSDLCILFYFEWI